MSELESTDNFRSFVNGDGDNDVTEVYENDDDDQHDVRVEDEEEVDSELQNDDDGDYDDFWIPGLSKEECISIDSMVDIRQFDMKEISDEVVGRLDFGDLELAYQFYCWYAKISGFSVRNSHIVRNTCMETLQQTFDIRKMSASDIMQVENYRKVGIRPPHMYTTFANQCGGYDKVRFIRKDIYNEEGRMRKQHSSDARGALKYLYDLRKKDPMMYVSYTADGESRLQWLFWCDTESQLLYEVFADVLAFDATYKKNKYLCPFVIFSGVNHHNQTIVFAAAIVTDETEETYVWLLEQLLVAMKGKAPCSIITDGGLAMRNAITRVMSSVFHKLCLMLGDFEVVKFEEKWKEMVATFELEDNTWIAELYEKWMKWSTAHLRGCFFAGIRTTSRCEAFHAHVAKYVHSRTNLTDFLPSSLILNRWSKLATKQMKDKYPNFAMYWDSQLMARYATLVEVSRQVCVAAYRDEEEYDKMLHFLSNEARRLKSKQNTEHYGDDFDGILDPVVVRSKGCGQVGMDECDRQRRIQKCGQCSGIGHNKRSCTNRPRNGNATHENNSEVVMKLLFATIWLILMLCS
uniref:MULE transposase domain-containing protein n=1 Tax=Glycine max TaxID=3847 RepID=K7KWG9_SOYBN